MHCLEAGGTPLHFAAAGAAISLRGKAALVKAGDRKGAQAAGRAAEAAQAEVAASGGPAKVA